MSVVDAELPLAAGHPGSQLKGFQKKTPLSKRL